jgi:hypothetical protein
LIEEKVGVKKRKTIKKLIKKLLSKTKNKAVNLKKTILSEEPFGIRAMENLSVGDLVKWTGLCHMRKEKSEKVGIISELYLKKRGNREVALARVYVVRDNSRKSVSVNREEEILVVNLEVLSRIGEKRNYSPPER